MASFGLPLLWPPWSLLLSGAVWAHTSRFAFSGLPLLWAPRLVVIAFRGICNHSLVGGRKGRCHTEGWNKDACHEERDRPQGGPNDPRRLGKICGKTKLSLEPWQKKRCHNPFLWQKCCATRGAVAKKSATTHFCGNAFSRERGVCCHKNGAVAKNVATEGFCGKKRCHKQILWQFLPPENGALGPKP